MKWPQPFDWAQAASNTYMCIMMFISVVYILASSTFKCRLRVTRIQTLQAEFTAELADPTSQDFQSMAADMTSVVSNKIF